MPIYMNYNSLAVKGDAIEPGHKGWIVLNSCQWGVGRSISTPVGSGANREGSTPSISEITVSKMLDAGSTKLLTEALVGKGVPCQIDFCTTDTAQAVYLTLTLENTMVSGYSMSSGGDHPSESVSLNFSKIEFKNFPRDSAGKVGKADPVAYDLGEGKKV